MFVFNKDSKNAWNYTLWTVSNLALGFYFLPYMNQYHLYTNIIMFVVAMGIQMYWCVKYLNKELIESFSTIHWIFKNWLYLIRLDTDMPDSIEFNKFIFYIDLGCDKYINNQITTKYLSNSK